MTTDIAPKTDTEIASTTERDIVIKFEDAQIREVLVRVNREKGAPIVYANISKFSRLGVDFVLDLVQIDPAEFQLLIQRARQADDKPSTLETEGKVVARVLLGPIAVRNIGDQADKILEGVEVTQPMVGDNAAPLEDTQRKVGS